MVHWQRRKKTQETLEAAGNDTEQNVVLSAREIAKVQAYVKRYYKEEPEKPIKTPASGMKATGTKSRAFFSSDKGLDGFLRQEQKRNDTFARHLIKQLENHGKKVEVTTISQLLKKTHVDKGVGTAILDDKSTSPYLPDKDTVFKFGLCLKLSLEEMNDLLAAAGYSLSNNKRDLVIKYCIREKIYTLYEVDARVVEITGKSLYKIKKTTKKAAV